MTLQTFCPNCGAALIAGAEFCSNCGYRVSGAASATQGHTVMPGKCPHCQASGPEGVFCRNCSRYMPDPTGDRAKVTFNRRFWGTYLLEGLLFAATLFIGWYIWLAFTAPTSQSPAKRLLNVYIIDLEAGRTISTGRVWLREVLVKQILFDFIISAFTGGLGSLVDAVWVFFDKNRQSLHDKVVYTIVVYAPNGLPLELKRTETS
jgi:uncharacterized RDD family membrane protein YckC